MKAAEVTLAEPLCPARMYRGEGNSIVARRGPPGHSGYGFTAVVVILRHGNPKMELSLESLGIRGREGAPHLAVTLSRMGNRSVYANARVIRKVLQHNSADDGSPSVLIDRRRRVP